ncbi:MAG: KOW domain-containing RNA-binding protein [Acutalibacteraceae bacterium]|nr:KOW domain-containing RNA-binding protein [Acutalibacteraceae bacterium]
MKAGQIVKSIAGRDKNSFFVITAVDEKFAIICDGKHRPVEKQKRKKLIHLRTTNYNVDLNEVKTNKEFKRVLHRFNYE